MSYLDLQAVPDHEFEAYAEELADDLGMTDSRNFSDPANLRAVVNAFIPGGVTYEKDGTVLAQGDDECEVEGPSDFLCADCGRSLLEGLPDGGVS